MKAKVNWYLIILLVSGSFLVNFYKNNTASDFASIPKERADWDGSYNESALARRLARELENDAILSALMSANQIYIAQSGSKIVLKGKTKDQYTLQRIVYMAYNIKGVTEVDTSQVKTFKPS